MYSPNTLDWSDIHIYMYMSNYTLSTMCNTVPVVCILTIFLEFLYSTTHRSRGQRYLGNRERGEGKGAGKRGSDGEERGREGGRETSL